jgi:hypothetical protein
MISPEPPPQRGVASDAISRGANAAPTEYARPVRVGAASAEASAPTGTRGGRSFGKEAAIRTYLASRFVFAPWYPQVREIVVVNGRAIVSTLRFGGKEQQIASQICARVLESGLVGEAGVRTGARLSAACGSQDRGGPK